MLEAGLEPAQRSLAEGFSYHYGFRRRPSRVRARLVCGLDYTFILGAFAPLDAARLVSTPSAGTYVPEAWLGIAM